MKHTVIGEHRTNEMIVALASPGRQTELQEAQDRGQRVAAEYIYHACQLAEWQAAVSAGAYLGSSQDRADGFIHCSSADQLAESLAKHRAGQDGLVLLVLRAATVGAGLRWEPSRGGALFPHIYGPLPMAAVEGVHPLMLDGEGRHLLPPLPDLPAAAMPEPEGVAEGEPGEGRAP